MSKVEKRTFSITAEQAAYIDAKVASGQYATGSEIVRQGLRAMQQHDEMIDKWLVEKVIPAYDEWKANPEKVRDIDEVFDKLEADILERASRKAS
jgi:antitoxin ParD1/3/4